MPQGALYAYSSAARSNRIHRDRLAPEREQKASQVYHRSERCHDPALHRGHSPLCPVLQKVLSAAEQRGALPGGGDQGRHLLRVRVRWRRDAALPAPGHGLELHPRFPGAPSRACDRRALRASLLLADFAVHRQGFFPAPPEDHEHRRRPGPRCLNDDLPRHGGGAAGDQALSQEHDQERALLAHDRGYGLYRRDSDGPLRDDPERRYPRPARPHSRRVFHPCGCGHHDSAHHGP